MAEIESEVGIRVAVYGATGAMGRQVLLALEGYGLPIDHLVAVGGASSAGACGLPFFFFFFLGF